MSDDSAFDGVDFPVQWCETWGMPCYDTIRDGCCENKKTIRVVSLEHAKDVERDLKAQTK